jgi:molecular chaperone DnaK
MEDREPIIGIDLGTTNSVVATVHEGQPVVIQNRVGQNLTPSVVAIASGGKRLVGQIAKRQAITNPQNTVYAAKRLIGRKFSSPQVQQAMKVLPYVVTAGEHDDVRIRMGDRDWSLPEVSALILRELKLDAEAFLGRSVTRAIITVPAYFNDGQRQATKDAGRIAGLEVMRIINEPTAAALAYGFGKGVRGKVAVFDLGGGTLDVSVLNLADGVFEVVATGGDTFLGGEDWDDRVMGWLADGFERQHQGIDLRQDRLALQRLKDAAEKAKIELSTVKTVPVRLPFLYTPPSGGAALHYETELSREKLLVLTADLRERAINVASSVLQDAKLRPEDLKEVLLVGGMTRMPAIQEAVKAFFKREPSKGVHPDEVVALGAALHAGSLTSEVEQSQLLLDVTPQSLGVAIAGGYVRTLIPKNTTIPTATKQIFNTSRDNQTTVKILVLQGENEAAYKNELLGEFVLSGLREAPRGEVEVEVTFEIDAEGLVSVSAKDRVTGKKAAISLTASGGLTDDELRRILESQHEYMVDAKNADELRAKLQAKIQEVKAILPLVRVEASAAPLVKAAEAQLARVSWALSSADPMLAVKAGEELSASLELLKGVYHQRLGGRR